MLHALDQHFKEGGWGMWPLVFLLVVTVSLFIERAWVIFRERADHDAFLVAARALVIGGALDRAILLCVARPSAVARMTLAALQAADRSEPEVRAAMQQSALAEGPRFERRAACFVSLANVAVCAGVLGTVTGWIPGSFGYGAGDGITIDPARKTELLAGSISEAMNCMAGGLAVAMVALACFSLVKGRAQRLLSGLDEAAASIAHALAIRRSDRNGPHPYRAAPPE